MVNPGGTAQTAHRDYHLGFMDLDLAAQFPAHVHRLSPVLTLQGAVAHVDMPVETGPTMYLPHSQKYLPGYMAIGLPEFQEYFEAHYVQLPLEKGDAVFFNPALLHGAGTNRTTDVKRMANLLQVSSAFGRALGTVDTERVAEARLPDAARPQGRRRSEKDLHNVVAAAAEGYPFPTNLDRDTPVGSLNPESQAQLVWRALRERLGPGDLRGRAGRADRAPSLVAGPMTARPRAVQVGVIGAGIMGADHARTLARWVWGAEVTAIADVDLGRAEAVAAEVGARASTTRSP